MHDADALASLPPAEHCTNSLIASVYHAIQRLGVPCDITHVLAYTGWGFGFVAAEEWCDPAVLLWHPLRLSTPPVRLIDALTYALCRLQALGIACRDAWFDKDTIDTLPTFLAHHAHHDCVLIVWGCAGPGYSIVEWVAGCGFRRFDDAQHVITPAALDSRGGIHCIVLSRIPHATVTSLTWHDIVAPLNDARRIEFATPQHPLRAYQTWHCGINAWQVYAATATQAAPLSLVSTHVAQIIHDYAWRLMSMRTLLAHWHGDEEHHLAQLQLHAALDDCCFYVGILYKHYGQLHTVRALTVADGELIAQACDAIATTLRDVCVRIGVAQAVWWAEQDSNL
ncbi:MAG: hypothetical protein ACK45X_14165 [Roseiflexaceae bacterium]|jgi:hypothetical protein